MNKSLRVKVTILGIGHKKTRQKTDKIVTIRRQTLINSSQTPRGSAEIPLDLRTRHPNPNESHHRAGVPRLTLDIHTQRTGKREEVAGDEEGGTGYLDGAVA
jgi:hypothetical protein